MKLLVPAYGSKMRTFAIQTARTHNNKIAGIINPNSGPGDEACLGPHKILYNALIASGSEAWLYIDLVAGPQYSPCIDAQGRLWTPSQPRNKTVAELKRELAAYTAGGFTAATGFFIDDATSKEHKTLISQAFDRRSVMVNPGNWKDAQKFRVLPYVDSVVIFESRNWKEEAPSLPRNAPFQGLAVIDLECAKADWKASLEAARTFGACYFYATDRDAAFAYNSPASYGPAMAKAISKT